VGNLFTPTGRQSLEAPVGSRFAGASSLNMKNPAAGA
jgi:hypothetical protein